MSRQSAEWIVTPEPVSHPRLRLFCFACAGGGPQSFSKWHDFMPAGVELNLIQLPGRGARIMEPSIDSMAGLVEALLPPLISRWATPAVFFGHSLGAFVAYECSCALRTAGFPLPRRLLVAGQRAPQLPDPEAPVYRLPNKAFIEMLCGYREDNAVLLDNADLREMLLPMLRADFCVCDTYHYQPSDPLDCSLTALCGDRDTTVSHKEIQAWQYLTQSDFEVVSVSGDHFFVESPDSGLQRLLAGLLEMDPVPIPIRTLSGS